MHFLENHLVCEASPSWPSTPSKLMQMERNFQSASPIETHKDVCPSNRAQQVVIHVGPMNTSCGWA